MIWNPFWRDGNEPIIDSLTGQGILRHERMQIQSLGAWYKEFRALAENQHVPEFRAYVQPIIIPAALKVRIYEQELYSFVLLSGVYKNSNISIMGLFPTANKAPPDYSYIRIIAATKKVLFDVNKNLYDAVIIDEYELLDPLQAYAGVPYERNVLYKLFSSAFDKGPIAESLQAPLLSAPKVVNGKGGIGFGAALDKTDFVIGLRTVMHEMLPLELQQLPALGKPRIIETPWPSISAHASQNPLQSSHVLNFISPSSFKALGKEEIMRVASAGEYSYAATTFAGDSKQELYRDIADNFFRSDISAIDLGQEYTDEMAFYRLGRDITEDVRTNIAHAHLIRPAIAVTSAEQLKLREMLRADMGVHYAGLEYNEGQSFLSIQAKQAFDNATRIAQTLARGRGDSVATIDDIHRARVIINSHLERFTEHGGGAAKHHLKHITRSDRWNEIRSVLQNGRATTIELWADVKQYKSFNTIEELQAYLDDRERAGHIVLIAGRYLLSSV